MTDNKTESYIYARFLHRKKGFVDLELNSRADSGVWTATYRMDRLHLDRFIDDLCMARYIQDGKTIDEASELVESEKQK